MNWLPRLWRWLVPDNQRPQPTNGERAQVRRRLTRINQRLTYDLAQLSQDMEDGWRRRQ